MISTLLNSRLPEHLKSLPWLILLVVTAISLFGCVILYSAAGGNLMPWALPQGLRFLVFLVAAIMLAHVPLSFWMKIAYPAYFILFITLMLVELLGKVAGGSQRWLDLGIIRIQPSELMKIAVILALARFYHYLPRGQAGKWSGMIPPLVLSAMPAVLVLMQPDLGTTITILAAGIITMFLGGLPWRWILIPGAAGLAALPILYSMLHPYQQRRVQAFLDPEIDPLGAGYHITQSKIAIGSGGLFGKGFMNGTQSHLDYLPEPHTDFIFSTMAEEWGFVGGVALWLGYGIWLSWGLKVARQTESIFGRILIGGLTATLLLYVLINSMMVMGLAPVVGIPFPLVSYGGSAMMTVMIALGLMISVYRQREAKNI